MPKENRCFALALTALLVAIASPLFAITDVANCTNLSIAGENYRLVGNISASGSNCINITAPNVSLDCRGNFITGNSAAGTAGIYSGQFNSTIRNCQIRLFDYGIYYSAASNGTIAGNNVSNAKTNGIYLYNGANYSLIANNSVINATTNSIYLFTGCGNSLLFNNTVNTTTNAFRLNTNCNYNTVANNTAAGASYTDVYVQSSSNNIIANNSATSNTIDIESGSNNNIVSNNTVTAVANNIGIYLHASSSNNTVSGNAVTSQTGEIIYLDSSSNNAIVNNTAISPAAAGYAISLMSNSNNNVVANNTANAAATNAVYLSSSSGNLIANNSAASNSNAAIYLTSSSSNNVTNNTASSNSSNALSFQSNSNANIVVNNTASSPASTAISLSSNCLNNLFYNNTVSGAKWVDSPSGTNNFNTSGIGNIYYFANGTGAWRVYNITDSNGDGWADNGTARPFNQTTVGAAYWVSGGADWYPYTTNLPAVQNSPPAILSISIYPASPKVSDSISCNVTARDNESSSINISYYWNKNGMNQITLAGSINISNNTNIVISTLAPSNLAKGDNWSCAAIAYDGANYSALDNSANVSIANSAPTIASDISFSNAGIGHWFFANATASDADGAGDISSWSISATAGACANYSNSSAGNSKSAVYNCSALSPSTPSVQITFVDSSGASASTSNSANAYPDHAASLSSPAINDTSPPATSILYCNEGAWSDLDGDLESASARTWQWNKNGVVIAGQAGQALDLHSITVQSKDNVSCRQYSTAQNWVSSTASAISGNVSIANSAPTIASDISFSNASNGHWFFANATASDADGGIDITDWGIGITSGSCTNYSNSTAGANLSLVFNCSGIALENAIANITFTDSSGASISTSGGNAYPNNAPSPPSSLLPNGSERFDLDWGAISINWTASADADGDEIMYYVYYSQDGGASYIFLGNTTSTEYWWNLTGIAAGSAYRALVYANDSYGVSANVSSAADFELHRMEQQPAASRAAQSSGSSGGGSFEYPRPSTPPAPAASQPQNSPPAQEKNQPGGGENAKSAENSQAQSPAQNEAQQKKNNAPVRQVSQLVGEMPANNGATPPSRQPSSAQNGIADFASSLIGAEGGKNISPVIAVMAALIVLAGAVFAGAFVLLKARKMHRQGKSKNDMAGFGAKH